MSRFFIKVEDGAKFVLESFLRMHGGEIFVPKLPTIYIKDLISALNKKYEIIGIRPGEKLHETMCSKEESHLVVEFKKHFIIKPSIILSGEKKFNKDKTGDIGRPIRNNLFEYSSNTNSHVLSVPQIKQLLESIKI